MSPDVLYEEAGCPSSSDCGERGHEVRSLRHLVYDYHNRIMACGLGELYDEVYADGVPRCVWDWVGVELSYRVLPLCFSPEAEVTGSNILPDVPGHLWPPVAPRHQL